MSTERIPDDARASCPVDARAFANREHIASAIEEEIARLKALRPSLEARIDRASHLLVVHLSDPARVRSASGSTLSVAPGS
jgi:hypothetical protein